MADITSIDRATARKLAAEAEVALQAVADKYGVTVKVGGGSFTSTESTTKFTFCVEGADEAAFARYAEWYGLTAEDFGRTFKAQGRTFKLTGINTRRPKFPFSGVEVSTGKQYKFPEAAVKAGLLGANVKGSES